MATRQALLKRNPIVIAARSLIERNAINPDRVDLDSLQVLAMGDKSVQIRAEIMITVPLVEFSVALGTAQDEIRAEVEEQRVLADQAEHEVAIAAGDALDQEGAYLRGEDLEPDGDILVSGAEDDGF